MLCTAVRHHTLLSASLLRTTGLCIQYPFQSGSRRDEVAEYICLLQNLTLAFGSILCLALPAVFGWIPLWKAVAFHEGCTLLVALNSLKVLLFARQKWCAFHMQGSSP